MKRYVVMAQMAESLKEGNEDARFTLDAVMKTCPVRGLELIEGWSSSRCLSFARCDSGFIFNVRADMVTGFKVDHLIATRKVDRKLIEEATDMLERWLSAEQTTR